MRVEARWLRATRDDERRQITRDAELLADRVEESLPGALQNRERTNLYEDERRIATPPTSYYGEVSSQTGEMWSSLKDAANRAAETASVIENTLLLGGGLLLGWKVFGYLRDRQRQHTRGADGRTRGALNASLERAATRDAPPHLPSSLAHLLHPVARFPARRYPIPNEAHTLAPIPPTTHSTHSPTTQTMRSPVTLSPRNSRNPPKSARSTPPSRVDHLTPRILLCGPIPLIRCVPKNACNDEA